ncbi:MAG TPA: GvpL/GvpF family gas vesicle protein [Terriglobales bacterium]|nr:GvpL/GvpF family gas vesicle protein [Terriglobales bacterium]
MAPGIRSGEEPVVYLYGITRISREIPAIAGVDDRSPIETLTCAGLICWISRVSRTEFADNLPKNIENLDWLAGMSVRHQRAVSAIAEAADILPARFGTVFLSDASLCDDVKSRKTELTADFKRIAGSEEWGVKVFALTPPTQLPGPLRSGKDYLQAKSSLLHKQSRKEPDEEIVGFAEELKALAVATADGGSIGGGRRDLQYQTSLLLKKSDRKKLQVLLERFAKKWKQARSIECSGPWPPYSFVSRSIQ